ncbi:phosphotransferase [uncultured Thiodictyon sp.]|uniref:aminoglycoside phosphotransferase family protein n=1 Tax=uncultured Thiodictyon sp. TaxID=1846217 RepID=UPI0025E09671|nr:phosphotransferase [uncultured Thiodictyon sp.]
MSARHDLLRQWLVAVLGREDFTLEPASADASFRRYWRARYPGHTLVLMDAPPAQEDCGRFVDLARRLRAIGLHTPEVYAEDRARGFLALSDLGDRLYLAELDAQSADRLYADALAALAVLQTRGPQDGLPVYDAPFLLRELEICREWFLGRHLGLALSAGEQAGWDRACETLVAAALEQPRVCVHRDYHSRNLMITEAPGPGILDFQDAVVGPVTYDLVSLLKDCYIQWPAARVTGWALGYLDGAVASGLLPALDPDQFMRWFDLMGAQRHLKACGIFARLHHRDGKPGYLNDIPRTLGYVREVAARYPELADLDRLLTGRVVPAR